MIALLARISIGSTTFIIPVTITITITVTITITMTISSAASAALPALAAAVAPVVLIIVTVIVAVTVGMTAVQQSVRAVDVFEAHAPLVRLKGLRGQTHRIHSLRTSLFSGSSTPARPRGCICTGIWTITARPLHLPFLLFLLCLWIIFPRVTGENDILQTHRVYQLKAVAEAQRRRWEGRERRERRHYRRLLPVGVNELLGVLPVIGVPHVLHPDNLIGRDQDRGRHWSVTGRNLHIISITAALNIPIITSAPHLPTCLTVTAAPPASPASPAVTIITTVAPISNIVRERQVLRSHDLGQLLIHSLV